MSRDGNDYLADIKTASEKIQRFSHGMDREAFFDDDRTFHAVVHCRFIVGEAAKHTLERDRNQDPRTLSDFASLSG